MASADKDPPLREIKDEKGNLLYSIQQRLGEGGYGCVYDGTDTNNNNKVAVKFEPKNKCNYGTPYEWEVYSALNRIKDSKTKFNNILYKCSSGEHYIMVMDMLRSINVHHDKKPSLKDVYRFAIEALKIFKDLHQAGYIHGDVKLGNFLSKPHSENSDSFFDELCLVDFGLASRWKDNSTGFHVEYSQHPNKFRGTMTYASVHALLGRTASRRDDLISLLYTLIELMEFTCLQENKDKYFRRNKDKLANCQDKMKMNLCFLPTKFEEFAKNVMELEFDELPKYDEWITEFESILMVSPEITRNPSEKKLVYQIGKTRWIIVVSTRCPMKQSDTWALIMDENKSFIDQEIVDEAINTEDSKSTIKNGNSYITALIKKANTNADGKANGNAGGKENDNAGGKDNDNASGKYNDNADIKADDNADGKTDDKAADKAANKTDGKTDDNANDVKWQVVKSKGNFL